MSDDEPVVSVTNDQAPSCLVLVCEHASRFIPPEFGSLGLAESALESHVVWDPGALAVAGHLSRLFNAKLVSSAVSRLVYDCNRPPCVADAMPTKSETIVVPGNANLDADARANRIHRFYEPFRAALVSAIASTETPVIVTVHSFTAIYFGKKRDLDIGILHDSDSRLADQMLSYANEHAPQIKVMRNKPYGPEHGVTHTLKEHAIAHGYLNVMLEIRNNLIATPSQQADMAQVIAGWLSAALSHLGVKGAVSCCD